MSGKTEKRKRKSPPRLPVQVVDVHINRATNDDNKNNDAASDTSIDNRNDNATDDDGWSSSFRKRKSPAVTSSQLESNLKPDHDLEGNNDHDHSDESNDRNGGSWLRERQQQKESHSVSSTSMTGPAAAVSSSPSMLLSWPPSVGMSTTEPLRLALAAAEEELEVTVTVTATVTSSTAATSSWRKQPYKEEDGLDDTTGGHRPGLRVARGFSGGDLGWNRQHDHVKTTSFDTVDTVKSVTSSSSTMMVE
jgi:hypothetical protein